MAGYEQLFARERLLALEGAVIVASHQTRARKQNQRFEGVYGRIYDMVIKTSVLRRSAFSLWGSADPLHELEEFVADAVSAAPGSAATIVDLASGAGMLLPLLDRRGFRGTVVEVDLAAAMLARAITLHRKTTPSLSALFVQADALDLPLADGSA